MPKNVSKSVSVLPACYFAPFSSQFLLLKLEKNIFKSSPHHIVCHPPILAHPICWITFDTRLPFPHSPTIHSSHLNSCLVCFYEFGTDWMVQMLSLPCSRPMTAELWFISGLNGLGCSSRQNRTWRQSSFSFTANVSAGCSKGSSHSKRKGEQIHGGKGELRRSQCVTDHTEGVCWESNYCEQNALRQGRLIRGIVKAGGLGLSSPLYK